MDVKSSTVDSKPPLILVLFWGGIGGGNRDGGREVMCMHMHSQLRS